MFLCFGPGEPATVDELTANRKAGRISLYGLVVDSELVPVSGKNLTEWVKLREVRASEVSGHKRSGVNRCEGLLSEKESLLQRTFVILRVKHDALGFLVELFALEGFLDLVQFAVGPVDLILEGLDSLLQILRALESTALTTSDRVGVDLAGNGFAAFTNIEQVFSAMPAVLDFAEAEVLGVGVGNDCIEFAEFHIAMIWCWFVDVLFSWSLSGSKTPEGVSRFG